MSLDEIRVNPRPVYPAPGSAVLTARRAA